MQKVKRLNPYRKARQQFCRLTVKSDFNGREMIVIPIFRNTEFGL
jgi:hypothetical protein